MKETQKKQLTWEWDNDSTEIITVKRKPLVTVDAGGFFVGYTYYPTLSKKICNILKEHFGIDLEKNKDFIQNHCQLVAEKDGETDTVKVRVIYEFSLSNFPVSRRGEKI